MGRRVGTVYEASTYLRVLTYGVRTRTYFSSTIAFKEGIWVDACDSWITAGCFL